MCSRTGEGSSARRTDLIIWSVTKDVAVNPWLEVPDTPPFVVPVDERYVEAFNASDCRRPEHEIDTTLLPEPWLGRHDAPVVMLTANPGFDPSDVAFHARPDFAQANRANLTTPGGEPNYLLDQRFSDAPGAGWWRRRAFAQLLRDGVSEEALRNRVLVVEFHGYHSRSWTPLPVTLPSQWYGFSLVEQAVRRGALVIVARPARLWLVAVPELGQHPERVFTLRSTQNPAISPKNLGSQAGYEAVVAAQDGRSRIEADRGRGQRVRRWLEPVASPDR